MLTSSHSFLTHPQTLAMLPSKLTDSSSSFPHKNQFHPFPLLLPKFFHGQSGWFSSPPKKTISVGNFDNFETRSTYSSSKFVLCFLHLPWIPPVSSTYSNHSLSIFLKVVFCSFGWIKQHTFILLSTSKKCELLGIVSILWASIVYLQPSVVSFASSF